MIHNHVVDTSLIFPHRLGPPFKKALKTLAAERLNKIIQEDGRFYGKLLTFSHVIVDLACVLSYMTG